MNKAVKILLYIFALFGLFTLLLDAQYLADQERNHMKNRGEDKLSELHLVEVSGDESGSLESLLEGSYEGLEVLSLRRVEGDEWTENYRGFVVFAGLQDSSLELIFFVSREELTAGELSLDTGISPDIWGEFMTNGALEYLSGRESGGYLAAVRSGENRYRLSFLRNDLYSLESIPDYGKPDVGWADYLISTDDGWTLEKADD